MRQGFSLIELMVAVSVLAIGIVSVARARLTIVSALDTTSTQIRALQILDEGMGALIEEEKAFGGIEPKEEHESVRVGNRPGEWSMISSLIEVPMDILEVEEGEEVSPAPGTEEQEEQEPVYFYEVITQISWREEARVKKVALASYFAPVPEEDEERGE